MEEKRTAEQWFDAYLDEMLADINAKAEEHAASVRAAIERLQAEAPESEARKLVEVKPSAPFTVFGKTVECSRCHTSPLSAQEFQNGGICHVCANQRGGIISVPPRHAMTQNVPLAWELKHPGGAVAVDQPTAMNKSGTPCPRSECSGTLERDYIHRTQNCVRCSSVFTDEMLSFISSSRVVAVDHPPATTAGFVAGGSFDVPGFVRRGSEPLCVVCNAELPDPEGRWLHAVVFPGVALNVVTCNTDVCKDQADAATRRRVDLQVDGNGDLVPSVPIKRQSPVRWATPEEQREHEERSKPKPGDPPRPEAIVLHGPCSFEMPIAKAPPPEASPLLEARLGGVRLEPSRRIFVDTDDPPSRPDGFSQAAVDAAKAVMLAPAKKRGGQ